MKRSPRSHQNWDVLIISMLPLQLYRPTNNGRTSRHCFYVCKCARSDRNRALQQFIAFSVSHHLSRRAADLGDNWRFKRVRGHWRRTKKKNWKEKKKRWFVKNYSMTFFLSFTTTEMLPWQLGEMQHVAARMWQWSSVAHLSRQCAKRASRSFSVLQYYKHCTELTILTP